VCPLSSEGLDGTARLMAYLGQVAAVMARGARESALSGGKAWGRSTAWQCFKYQWPWQMPKKEDASNFGRWGDEFGTGVGQARRGTDLEGGAGRHQGAGRRG
jgi:hypothetical protein